MRFPIDYSQNLLISSPSGMIEKLAFEVMARRKTTPATSSTVDLPGQSKLSDLAGVLSSLGIQSI